MSDDIDHDRTHPTETQRARGIRRVAKPARHAIASVAAAAEPLVGRIGDAVEGVERSIAERPGMRVRRIRRRAANPLPYLNDAYPDVRLARSVQVGLRTIPVDAIAGTAVGGGDQRGADFLPLKQFRGGNWKSRWQRLNRAQDSLAILPPIEAVKYKGQYWVLDGHNRVALALYSGQPEIDASIVELVAPGEQRTEPLGTLAPTLAGSQTLRTRGEGLPASGALSHEDRVASDPDDA